MPAIQKFLTKFRKGDFVCAVAFGSSNTERRLEGMHWFDCFELACRKAIGRHLVCINSGWGGNTATQLMERIERDCLRYQPDLVFVTVGGNDSNPVRKISSRAFRKTYAELIRRIRDEGGEPLLQTYYAFHREKMDPKFFASFSRRMQEVREIAAEHQCDLIDHLSRWEPLQRRHPAVYTRLMADGAHVTPEGNLLIGVDVVRTFGLELPPSPAFREALALQALLDDLSPDTIPRRRPARKA